MQKGLANAGSFCVCHAVGTIVRYPDRYMGRQRRLIPGEPKTCNRCGELKQPEQFYLNPSSNDGRRSYCIVCSKQYYCEFYTKNGVRLRAKTEAWRREHLDQAAQNRRNWYSRNPKLVRKAVDDWRARNPLKAAAHFAVMYALKGGHIQRSPCVVCGSEKVQAHHHDYSNPLQLQWLCSLHQGHAQRSVEEILLADRFRVKGRRRHQRASAQASVDLFSLKRTCGRSGLPTSRSGWSKSSTVSFVMPRRLITACDHVEY